MFAHLNPDSSDFGYICALYAPFLHQLTMQSSLFEPGCPVLVVVCVAHKLRPCPSYSRRRDRINLVLWCSLCKGGAGYPVRCPDPPRKALFPEPVCRRTRAVRCCCGVGGRVWAASIRGLGCGRGAGAARRCPPPPKLLCSATAVPDRMPRDNHSLPVCSSPKQQDTPACPSAVGPAGRNPPRHCFPL